jgi:hypothetical protein
MIRTYEFKLSVPWVCLSERWLSQKSSIFGKLRLRA